MATRRPITAAFWWQSVGDTFEKIIREFLSRAVKAEYDEKGHNCGHAFTISIQSTLHASGPGEHTDADWDGVTEAVTVRAHNLRDALLIAATLPLSDWFKEEL